MRRPSRKDPPADDALVRRKTAPTAPVARGAPMLEVGELISADDGATIWEVERVSIGSAGVRCVVGGSDASCWSATSIVRRFTREEVDARRAGAAAARSMDRDERRCPECWGGDGLVDGVDRGRDQGCRAQVHAERASVPTPPAARRTAPVPDEDEVRRVLKHRAAGMTWRAIEKEMGWPDTKGNRAFRVARARIGPKSEEE